MDICTLNENCLTLYHGKWLCLKGHCSKAFVEIVKSHLNLIRSSGFAVVEVCSMRDNPIIDTVRSNITVFITIKEILLKSVYSSGSYLFSEFNPE